MEKFYIVLAMVFVFAGCYATISLKDSTFAGVAYIIATVYVVGSAIIKEIKENK